MVDSVVGFLAVREILKVDSIFNFVLNCLFFPGNEDNSSNEKMKCYNCDRKFNPFYDCWCRKGVWSEDKIESLRKKYNKYH